MAFQELVKGTPDWHEKYNSDFQDVHAQLANKVNSATGYGMPWSPKIPEDDYDQATVNGTFRAYSTTENAYLKSIGQSPQGEILANFCWDSNTRAQLAFYGSGIAYRVLLSKGNKNWKRLAFAESPQMFNLPLSSGLLGGYGSVYFKNPFGEVSVYFDIIKAENKPNDSAYAFDGTETLATLPVGFRPPHRIPFTATVFKPGQGYCAGIALVSPEGHIVPGSSGNGATIVRACFSFLAA